jgi:hypothetical protein
MANRKEFDALLEKTQEGVEKYHPEVVRFLEAAGKGNDKEIKNFAGIKDLREKITHYADQIVMDRNFVSSKISVEGNESPYRDMTYLLNGACAKFKEICKEDGFHEGIADRYLDIASLLPEAFKKTEGAFEEEIGKSAIKVTDVKKLFDRFNGSYVNSYMMMRRKYSKVNEDYWKDHSKGMPEKTAKKFIETIYESGKRIEDYFDPELSRKKMKVAARRVYYERINEEIGVLEKHYGDIPEKEFRKTAERLKYLAEQFDDLPVTRGEGPGPRLQQKLNLFLGKVKRYTNDPRVYSKLRESMGEIKHLLQYGGQSK